MYQIAMFTLSGLNGITIKLDNNVFYGSGLQTQLNFKSPFLVSFYNLRGSYVPNFTKYFSRSKARVFQLVLYTATEKYIIL